MEEWQLVINKKKKNKSKVNVKSTLKKSSSIIKQQQQQEEEETSCSLLTTEELSYWKTKVIVPMKNCFVLLSDLTFLIKEDLFLNFECTCLGLGSDFTKNGNRKPSNVQIAFAELLRERLKINQVFAYDPLFTKNDEIALKALNWEIKEITKQNSDEKKKKTKTIFYMPHCDRFLYNIVIEKNWDRMDEIIFISNSFKRYVENDSALGNIAGLNENDFVKKITNLPGYLEIDLLNKVVNITNELVLDSILLEKSFGDVCVIYID